VNTYQFSHPLTPAELGELNEQLATLLVNTDIEEEQRFQLFLQLVRQRDSLIQQHLGALDTEPRKQFAAAELTVNNQLNELAQSLLHSAKNDISHFIKSQSAIKKYK